MMFSRIGSGGCLCFLLIACGLVGPSDVEVRLENASSTAFAEATLFTVDGSHTYLDLGPGEASPYLNVTMAYGIATTQVVVGADTIRLQVIDYVGEEPLGAGCYTYVIGLEPTEGRPTSLTQLLREGC